MSSPGRACVAILSTLAALAAGLAARGASSSAFDQRCIPPGCACRRPNTGFGMVAPKPCPPPRKALRRDLDEARSAKSGRRRIAQRSSPGDILASRALPVGRIVGLDATTHLHHGLLADHPVSARQSRLASERQAGLTVDFVAVLDDGTPVVDLQLPDVEVRISGRVIRTLRKVAR